MPLYGETHLFKASRPLGLSGLLRHVWSGGCPPCSTQKATSSWRSHIRNKPAVRQLSPWLWELAWWVNKTWLESKDGALNLCHIHSHFTIDFRMQILTIGNSEITPTCQRCKVFPWSSSVSDGELVLARCKHLTQPVLDGLECKDLTCLKSTDEYGTHLCQFMPPSNQTNSLLFRICEIDWKVSHQRPCAVSNPQQSSELSCAWIRSSKALVGIVEEKKVQSICQSS